MNAINATNAIVTYFNLQHSAEQCAIALAPEYVADKAALRQRIVDTLAQGSRWSADFTVNEEGRRIATQSSNGARQVARLMSAVATAAGVKVSAAVQTVALPRGIVGDVKALLKSYTAAQIKAALRHIEQ